MGGQYVGALGESKKMREILGAWGECCLDRKSVLIRDTKG